ncbi:MAG: COR domain-containing protein [Nonlabens sp.]
MKYNKSSIATAKERIANVRKHKFKYLDLSGLGLTEIPEKICDLIYLLEVDLSYNRLQKFPKDLELLQNIQRLSINNNMLGEVVFDIGVHYSLQFLDISNNELVFIPDDLFNLNEECQIKFHGNPFLDNLPAELSMSDNIDLIQFYQQELKLKDNRKRLFEAKILFVGKGEVGKTTLMKTIINPNNNLKLGEEEQTHGINIENHYHKVHLEARQPYYSLLDAESLCFRIQNEDTEVIIDEHGEEIALKNEEIKFIPLHEYYYDLNDEDSLQLQISNQPTSIFPDILFEKEIKLNLWDFGGQEYLYGTHQFFLTQRSIYILMWDSRPDNEADSFSYWLSIIKRLSNSSPVFVVMNKSDTGIKQIDENSLKKQFNNIVGFYQLSCFSKKGVNIFISDLLDKVTSMPHICDIVPKTWDNLRVSLRQVNKNFISYDDFRAICKDYKLKDIEHLSSYLHDLGDIIHFKEDLLLCDMVIINPHWLTQAIYKLINSLEVQENKGIFSAKQLKSVLNNTSYSNSEYISVISIMEKFEICFKILDLSNQYIIPTLLSAQTPIELDMDYFDQPNLLLYEIHYEFLPSGILEKLICRKKLMLKNDLFWKYGAVLEISYATALIQINNLTKVLSVRVVGNTGSSLRSIIIQEIQNIHKSLKLQPEDFYEKIACNCSLCNKSSKPKLFKLRTLKLYMDKDKSHIDCTESATMVNVKDLLNGHNKRDRNISHLEAFIKASTILQKNKNLTQKLNENQINTLLQNNLRNLLPNHIITNEQSLQGASLSGKEEGEIDIALETRDGLPDSIYEGMILSYMDKTNINKHIEKLLINYDPTGLPEKFIGIYYRGLNFNEFYCKYFQLLKDNHPVVEGISELDVQNISNSVVNGSEIKCFRIKYRRTERFLVVYHLIINLK